MDDTVGQDLFLGGKGVKEGYDSFAIYDPRTGKHVGRYISKTPAGAAMKAARRLFKSAKATKVAKVGRKGKKGGEGDDDDMDKEGSDNYGDYSGMGGYYGGADDKCMTQYEALKSCLTTGGAKSEFQPGGKETNFILCKTTQKAKSSGKTVFYHFKATLKTYTRPLKVMRNGVEVTINHKIVVERQDLPPDVQRMADEYKAKKAMKAKKGDSMAKRAAAKAKKEAAKEKARAKKEAAKEKAAEKKAAKAAKLEAKKELARAKKAAKAAKAAVKPKKAKKTKKGRVGGSSCSMYY